jgi:hypothetical protein
LCGAVAEFVAVFVLNLAGLPGALIALRSGKGRKTFLFGSNVAGLGQSYVYVTSRELPPAILIALDFYP